MDRFILKCVDDDAKSAQIKHFVHFPEEHSKPLKLTVCEHAARLDAIVTRTHQLRPRNGDAIEIQQQKETLLASCPAAWAEAFNDANLSLDTIAYTELIKYLDKLKVNMDKKQEKDKEKKQNSNNKRQRFQSNGPQVNGNGIKEQQKQQWS